MCQSLSAVRKINELVKRVRLAKVHAYIIGYLKEQMPVMMGHAKKQAQVCFFLPIISHKVRVCRLVCTDYCAVFSCSCL